MALSYVQSLGDGTTRQFDLTFDYLSKSHVTVKVDGADVPFTWTGVYQVQTATPPPDGAVVERRRRTPRDKRLVTFTDGSTLVATDMNTSTLQSFFLAQEAFDEGAASMAVTEDGMYSAQTRRITLVGDPVNPQDVVTRSWAETGMTSQLTLAITARNLAQTAQGKSEEARDASNAYRASAAQERNLAETARGGAETALAATNTTKGQVDQLKADVTQLKTETGSIRDTAVDARDTALGYRNTTNSLRGETLGFRNEASGFRNESLTFRNQAEQFMVLSDATTRLSKAQNLSDLTDKVAARGNLEVMSAAAASSRFETIEQGMVRHDISQSLSTPAIRRVQETLKNGWEVIGRVKNSGIVSEVAYTGLDHDIIRMTGTASFSTAPVNLGLQLMRNGTWMTNNEYIHTSHDQQGNQVIPYEFSGTYYQFNAAWNVSRNAKGRFNAEVSSLREPGGDYPHILSRYHYYNNNGVWASGIGSARVPVGTYTGVRIIANTGNIQLTDFLIEGIKL